MSGKCIVSKQVGSTVYNKHHFFALKKIKKCFILKKKVRLENFSQKYFYNEKLSKQGITL